MSNTQPAVTVIYRLAAGMSMELKRRDFATVEAAQAWADKTDKDGALIREVEEFRVYDN